MLWTSEGEAFNGRRSLVRSTVGIPSLFSAIIISSENSDFTDVEILKVGEWLRETILATSPNNY